MSGRIFPVLWHWRKEQQVKLKQAGCPRSVPWAFVAPFEAQALKNHGQSLETLAGRGGLSISELVAVIDGHGVGWVMDHDSPGQVSRLLELLAAFEIGAEP